MSVYLKMQKQLFEIDNNASIMKLEVWRIIENCDNFKINNFGVVKNISKNRKLKQSVNAGGYKFVSLVNNNGKRQNHLIHRLIAIQFIENLTNKLCIDHINNDRTDNNIKNLRWCTSGENKQNASVSKNNTSGTKGIYWNKKANKWHVQIMINDKHINIGLFENKEDAILARKEKANELFGEFTNSCEKL